MRRIGHFIRIDPDEAALDPPPAAREIRRLVRLLRAAERAMQFRPEPRQERVGPSRLHLHDQRLALMRRHAGRVADRLTRPGLRQPALVQRMPRLMHHREHGERVVRLVIPRRDPHIRPASRPRMDAPTGPAEHD